MNQNIILIICMYTAAHFVGSREFSASDLEFVTFVQKEFCGAESLCDSEYADSLTETTRSLDDLPISPTENIPPDCCLNCSCDLTTCRDFGNCCPDILDRLPSLQEALQPKRVVCKTVSLKAIGEFYTYWLYSRCSAAFDAQKSNKKAIDIKSKCENPDNYLDLDTRQPVIDRITEKTYANKYCALCGFVEENNMVPFNTGLRCYNGANFFKSVNIETLVQDVLSTEDCDLEFYWPDDNVDFLQPLCKAIEVGCNTTGNWATYDPLIETACHTYTARYNYKYNNIFCYMCNEVEPVHLCADEAGRGTASVSFAAVLDFNRIPEQESVSYTQCSNNQVLDKYKGVCRTISCIFPRVLQSGQCVNVVSNLTEVSYIFQLKFTPLSQQKANELPDVIVVIEDYVRSLLTSWNVFDATANSNFFSAVSLVYEEIGDLPEFVPDFNEDDALPDTPNNDITEPVTTTKITTTSSQIKRRKREAENETNIEMEITIPTDDEDAPLFLPNIESQPNLKVAIPYIDYILWQVRWYFKNKVVQPHSSDFIENVLDLDKRNISLDYSFKNTSFSFSLSVEDYELENYNFPIDPIRQITLIPYPSFIFLPLAQILTPLYWNFQKIKPTMTCPIVKILNSEYNITNNSVGIFVEELNSTFYKPYIEITAVRPGKIEHHICSDSFLEVTDKYTLPQTSTVSVEEGITIQGVISVSFSCISILCSLLTLITYALFKDFRTQPGVNNMYLCVYLICAQSLFTFATPQEGIVSELACSVLGVLTHFFWLMVIFAMNVCCFHMVMVFKGKPENRANRGSNCFRSVMYNSYCVISSLFFVVVNIIVSFTDRDDNSVGYGKGLCYISQPRMVGYVFAIPLGVIIFTNIISFIFVIIRIRRASIVSSSSKGNRNLSKIYAKLSSLTGLTWILGFLYAFTKIEIFEYFFIIFNGGIGIFIFLSFVCNRRTFEKYKSLINKSNSVEKHSSRTSSSTKTTELGGDVRA